MTEAFTGDNQDVIHQDHSRYGQSPEKIQGSLSDFISFDIHPGLRLRPVARGFAGVFYCSGKIPVFFQNPI